MVEVNDIKHLVAVGAWNIAIFSPDWMKKFILSDYENINVEVPLAVNNSLRYTTEDFVFAIVNSRLEIMIKKKPQNAISCLRSILQKLIHTPIIAFGINYKFNANKAELCEALWKSFFVDSPLLKLNDTFIPEENTTTAIYRISDNNKLRLNVIKHKDESVAFDINYDYQVKSAQELIDVLGPDDSLFDNLHDRTISLLNDNFDLKL